MHLTTASATAAMRLKSTTCTVASQCRKRCRGFVRQRLLLQRALIAQMSSAFLVCLRRSRSSSVNSLTSRPFGRKLKSGRATRNRCCKGIQLKHVHVLLDERSATPGLQKDNIFQVSLVFPEERPSLQGHMAIEYNCRARCSVHHDIMQLRKVTSSLPHKRSPSQPLHSANSCRGRGRCAK